MAQPPPQPPPLPLPLYLRCVLLLLVGWLSGQQQDVIEYLQEENRILRARLGTERLRFTDAERRRLARRGQLLGRKLLDQVASLPETILRWYRRLVAQKYDSSQRRRPGRARVEEAIAALVVRVALENPGFGYTRICDAIHNLKREVSRSSVARILAEHGIEPAPERSKRSTWRTFLAAHWDTLAAADFFTVDVLTWVGLVRYSVLVVMELCTRRVHLSIVRHATADWTKQIFRNLTDRFDGFLKNTTHLILGRDRSTRRTFATC